MTKELSTLDRTRPTILDEKRRIERELGLAVEPSIVMPKSSKRVARPSVRARIARWIRG